MTTTAPERIDESVTASLFTQARTANTFSDEPVTDEELRSIWDLARFAPTMANSQPLRVLFVRTAEGKARLLPHMSEGNRAKTESAPVVAILAYDADFHEQFATTFPVRAEALHGQFDSMAPQSRAQVAKYSAALASGVFFIAARAHGLAVGPMGGFDAAGVDSEFFAGTSWKSHLVVNIGHPGQNPWFDRLPRVEVDDAVSWA